MKAEAILLSGGINHDFADSSAALASLFAENYAVRVFDETDEGLAALAQDGCQLLVLNTLRWRMLDDDKYIPFRDEWAYEMPLDHQEALQRHVKSGGGLLALHTACICFDTFAEWPLILGGCWHWGQTFHPPPETVSCHVVSRTHPVTQNLNDFQVEDEVYHYLDRQTGTEVLLNTSTSQDGKDQVLAWSHKYGEGRVIFSALGHDAASINQTAHRAFLKNAARWCGGLL